MSEPTVMNRRTHPAAVASFVLGLSSVILLALTGLPALYLGLRGLRAVNGSDGRLRGRGWPLPAWRIGGLGTIVTLLGACTIVVIELRARSNRVQSVNHLRLIGVALNKYADTHESFPPATRDPRGLPPDRRLSWMADVVPLLDEGSPKNKVYQDLARKIDRTKGWADPANAAVLAAPVRVFLCPDLPALTPDRSGALTYFVGMAGVNPRAAYLPARQSARGCSGTIAA